MVKNILITFFILLSLRGNLYSQTTSPADTFPVPKGSVYQLFYLQRQPNANTIVVELNVKNGKVNEDNPVHVFWIRYTEKGQRAELNFIQKTFAYGIKSKKIKDGTYDLNFVSYKKLKLRLQRDANNKWRVFHNLINGGSIILRRIYLHVNGGSFWHPHIDYTELKGNDPINYKEVRERIIVK